MKRRSMLFFAVWFSLILILSGCGSYKAKNTTPKETDVFLDKPDSIVYISNDTTTTLSDEALETVYSAFTELMSSFELASTLKTPFQESSVKEMKKEYTSIEFRYEQRRKYTGTLSETSSFTWGDIQFDAFLFILGSSDGTDSITAVPYLGSSYVAVNNNLYLLLNFPRESIEQFKTALNGAVSPTA